MAREETTNQELIRALKRCHELIGTLDWEGEKVEDHDIDVTDLYADVQRLLEKVQNG